MPHNPRDRYRRHAWVLGLLVSATLPAAPARGQDQPGLQPAGRRIPAEPATNVPADPSERRPAPAPATRPSPKELRAQIPKLFSDLANADPAVRENARVSLMGISRVDLDRLEQLVRENLPLVPAQAAVIREIVTHVYLSGEVYEAFEDRGFLGVRMLEVSIVSKQEADAANALVQEENPFDPRRPLSGVQTTGVLIMERMPGFAGARAMLDGDVVLGIVERPDAPIRSHTDMRDAVVSFKAGDTIRFQLLRQGQVINVPVTLDAMPRDADPTVSDINAMQRLIDTRKARALEYWERTFAPMLKEAAG